MQGRREVNNGQREGESAMECLWETGLEGGRKENLTVVSTDECKREGASGRTL